MAPCYCVRPGTAPSAPGYRRPDDPIRGRDSGGFVGAPVLPTRRRPRLETTSTRRPARAQEAAFPSERHGRDRAADGRRSGHRELSDTRRLAEGDASDSRGRLVEMDDKQERRPRLPLRHETGSLRHTARPVPHCSLGRNRAASLGDTGMDTMSTPDARWNGALRPVPGPRGSFVSLLIHEGRTVVDVASQAGHTPETCLRHYARLFRDAPAERVPAEVAIEEARAAVRCNGGRGADARVASAGKLR